jgi:hypothetical protein
MVKNLLPVGNGFNYVSLKKWSHGKKFLYCLKLLYKNNLALLILFLIGIIIVQMYDI